jgi:hypothetical protein
MVTVIRPSRARCVKGTIPRHERAVLPFNEGLRPQSSASTALLPPSALGERCHGSLARRLDSSRSASGLRGGHRPASTAMAGLSARPWLRRMPRALAARTNALTAWRSTPRNRRSASRQLGTESGIERHATAAPPSSVMNARRFISITSSPAGFSKANNQPRRRQNRIAHLRAHQTDWDRSHTSFLWPPPPGSLARSTGAGRQRR